MMAIDNITISNSAYEPSYNTGKFKIKVSKTTSGLLYTVSVYCDPLPRDRGLPEMLIAWAFTNDENRVSPLTETLIAACELVHSNF